MANGLSGEVESTTSAEEEEEEEEEEGIAKVAVNHDANPCIVPAVQ